MKERRLSPRVRNRVVVARALLTTAMMAALRISSRNCHALLSERVIGRRSPSNTNNQRLKSQMSCTKTLIPDDRVFPADIRAVMAPMVAASDYPFRCLMRQYGVDLTYTQMMHAKNLVKDSHFRKTHLDLLEYYNEAPPLIAQQERFLEGITGDVRSSIRNPEIRDPSSLYTKGPVMAQLAGSTVESVVQAGEIILENTHGNLHGLDLNLGCPQGIARKGKYGAFLAEEDFDVVCDILTALCQSVDNNNNPHYRHTMISAKIRLPLSDEVLVQERIPRLLATGISFLTIHGRTLHENKTKVRGCHVDRLRLAVDTAHNIDPTFPVIANGGVESFEDTVRVRQETGAAAVMSSEALLENPSVFQPCIVCLTPRERLTQQIQFAHDYLDWCTLYPPLPGVLGDFGSASIARSHLFKFLHRYLQEQPDLRLNLSDYSMTKLVKLREVVDLLQTRYDDMSDAELGSCSSSIDSNASWYRRHWDSLRLVHTKTFGGATAPADSPAISVEEKKALLRKRIAKLQNHRLMKS